MVFKNPHQKVLVLPQGGGGNAIPSGHVRTLALAGHLSRRVRTAQRCPKGIKNCALSSRREEHAVSHFVRPCGQEDPSAP
ncbi:unnamed protein product [Sphagnum tenellum]